MNTAKNTILAASQGAAVSLDSGQSVRVINTHGSQVVDTWAFAADDLDEYLSMEATRRMLYRLMPRAGDVLYSNRRLPLLTMTEDTSPGIHDTLFACCSHYVYEQMGCTEYHRNCADNLVEGMAGLGLKPPIIPNPLNLFMNIPVSNNLDLAIAAPVSRPGDYVTLKAERPSIVAFSACPMDLIPINGPDQAPQDVELEILA